MDGDRFDGITRNLAAGASRREVLRKLAGSVLGGTLAVAGLRRSGAAPAGKVGVCHRTGDPANPYNYIEVSANAANAHAAHGDVVAPDLANDPTNCDFCGNVCTTDVENAEAVCVGGECGYACLPVTCDPNFAPDPVTCVCVCAIDATDCPDRYLFDAESCSCYAPFCPVDAPYLSSCGVPDTGCFCEISIENTNLCFNTDDFIDCVTCTSSDDCPAGQACAHSPLSPCTEPHCHSLCDTLV